MEEIRGLKARHIIELRSNLVSAIHEYEQGLTASEHNFSSTY